MVAAVETMAYAHNFVKFDSKVPWHGEGVGVTEEKHLYDIDAFMERAGFIVDGKDITVYKEPTMSVGKAQQALNYMLRCSPEELAQYREAPIELESDTGTFAIKRSSDGRVLGQCAKVWQPYQPRQAFDWFKPFLEDKRLAFNTAGSLNDGANMWVLAQIVNDGIADVVKNDSICQFVLLSNPFDGKTSIGVGLSDIRVVCANTLQMAFDSKFSKMLRINHSSKTEQTMEDLQSALDIAKREFSVNIEKYRELAKHGVSGDSLRKYVRIVKELMSAPLTLNKAKEIVENTPWDKVGTRSQNTVMEIEGFMHDSRQATSSGTWWAAYNSVNQYLNYNYGRSADKRVSSLWFGKNATVNKQALNLALEMAV